MQEVEALTKRDTVGESQSIALIADSALGQVGQSALLPVSVGRVPRQAFALVETQFGVLVEDESTAAPQLNLSVRLKAGWRFDLEHTQLVRRSGERLGVFGDKLADHQPVRPGPGGATQPADEQMELQVDVNDVRVDVQH